MFSASRVVASLALSASLACTSMATAQTAAGPAAGMAPQYVIVSFDGAHDIAQWERSRRLAGRTGARFTYFLSCVFLLSKGKRGEYQPPGKGAGRSEVGFAQTPDEVARRLEQIRLATSEGHEIASHACGHFDGKDWSKKDWLAEFAQFRRILERAYVDNGLEEPKDWQDFAGTAMSGFRAPYLSTSGAMYEALREAGFRYDASGISKGPVEPHAEGGIERFALPRIPEGPNARRVIAMDYNLYVRHSGGKEQPDEAAAFQARSYEAFMAAFDREYEGGRAPLQLGFHFTLMNDGAYWKALERFAEDVCGKADVVCTSYQNYLERTAPGPARDGAAAGG
jgi:peptidoglycan/xylan/chitin deacetylase (PgdA/CDA1 family)